MPAPIVLVGDSITEQWGFLRPAIFEAFDLIPRGYSGWTAQAIATRLRADLGETEAAGLHLLCGINDIARNDGIARSPDAIAATLLGMLDLAHAKGLAAWIGTVLPAARIPWNPDVADVPAAIAAVNGRLRADAAAHGAALIDYHAVLAGPDGGLRPEFGTDGLHLSRAGYAAIEPLLLASLGRTAPPA